MAILGDGFDKQILKTTRPGDRFQRDILRLSQGEPVIRCRLYVGYVVDVQEVPGEEDDRTSETARVPPTTVYR